MRCLKLSQTDAISNPAPQASDRGDESKAKPEPSSPAPLSIADKIALRQKIKQRVDELLAAAGAQLTPGEQEVEKEIAFHGQVFGLLREDIANDRQNLATMGLVMPWELTARRNLLTHGRRALEHKVSNSALGLAARIGNEQLRSVQTEIDSLRRQQYRSIATRVWQRLSTDELEQCKEYLPEFAGEGSGANAAEESRLSEAIRSDTKNANYYEARARLRIARGELGQAANDLVACLGLKPDNEAQIRLLYAELLLELGSNDLALKQRDCRPGPARYSGCQHPLRTRANSIP